MAKFFLTNIAVDDLTKIWEYTCEEWSEKQADKYYALLIDACKEIAKNPFMGKQYEEIEKGILGSLVQKHIIFYRKKSEKEIEVLRILHCGMELKNRMND
ncbi:MAG: hypothetical protein RL065_1199 [Bacteroidota bacterium]|jgi:toxin ParE1/3/4